MRFAWADDHLAFAAAVRDLLAKECPPAVVRAAWSLAQGDGYDLGVRRGDVSLAKALATDAAEACGRAALQCHGAIGHTVEHDLHLYLKRSWAVEAHRLDRGGGRNDEVGIVVATEGDDFEHRAVGARVRNRIAKPRGPRQGLTGGGSR